MATPLPLVDEPRDLLLDENNNLVVTTNLQFSRGIPAILQSARIALSQFAGEWFLDLDAGIPYWQSILAQKTEAAVKAAGIAFRAALLSVKGITKVTRMDISVVNRRMKVTWRAITAFGETPDDVIALRIRGGATV